MKALIKVGYACNENCTFCHTADMRWHSDSAERVEWKIERARKLGYSMVVLSGGEPTIRPELLSWARNVARLGMDFGLVTNGLMLSYPHIADELIGACRLRYVYMSIHGGDPKVHASVVRADTFHKAFGALSALAGRVPDLTANCVVTTANIRHLRGLVDRLLPLGDLCIKFSMTQPKGAANWAPDVIIPDVAECARYVRDAIEYGLSKSGGGRVRFAHDGLPFCLLPGLHDLYDDLKTHRFAVMIEADEDDFVPVDDVAKFQPEQVCGGCSLRGACPGLYRGYAEAQGTAALHPLTLRERPRANSYNFVPERDIARPLGAPCPIKKDGVSPYDRGRTLFLRLKDRIRLFRTETRDFSDAELLHTKEELGQLYVDISSKAAPDDFSKDLRLLKPSDECVRCELRNRCTGTWEAIGTDIFSRDNAAVLSYLAALEGRVLDIGCGESPYFHALAGKAKAGRIEYVGVDPDPARMSALSERYPFAQFIAASAEELSGKLGSFDHVLLLRSFNHLANPQPVLAQLVRLLKVGGSLFIADNVAFGLLRNRAHAERAQKAQSNRFEHYRNDSASEAMNAIPAEVLRLVSRQDVRPGFSNQWFLHFERTAKTQSS